LKPTGKAVAAYVVKYALALFFVVIISGLTSNDYYLALLLELVRISLYPIIVSAGARGVGLFGYGKIEKSIKYVIANGIYIYLFTGIFIYLFTGIFDFTFYSSYHPTSYSLEFFGVFLFFYAINLKVYGGSMISSQLSTVGGRSAGIIGSSAFLASLGLLIASLPFSYLPVFQYPFEFASLALLPFSIAPFLLASNNEATSSDGKYMYDSRGRWSAVGFILGIMLSVLYIPKPAYLNRYIFILFLLVIVLVFLYVMVKVYSSSSKRMDNMTANVFEKFRHNVSIYADQRFQDIVSSVDQFIREGRKESLLIQLTMLLNSMEIDYQRISAILAPITEYEAPLGIRYGIFNLKSEIEAEISKRKNIVEQTVRNISSNSSGVAYG
jgi:hypothetical protein